MGRQHRLTLTLSVSGCSCDRRVCPTSEPKFDRATGPGNFPFVQGPQILPKKATAYHKRSLSAYTHSRQSDSASPLANDWVEPASWSGQGRVVSFIWFWVACRVGKNRLLVEPGRVGESAGAQKFRGSLVTAVDIGWLPEPPSSLQPHHVRLPQS